MASPSTVVFALFISLASVAIPASGRFKAMQWKSLQPFIRQGNAYWLLAYVAGAGDVGEMWVKSGCSTGWIHMSHNWGASYQAFAQLGGQPLSFKLTSYTTRQTIVAPANWWLGLTYEAPVNFK